MATSPLRSDQPRIAATCKDGSSWLLPLSEYDSIRAAFVNSQTYWEGLNIWGESVTIKMFDITGLTELTAESLALRDAENAEEKQRALLED